LRGRIGAGIICVVGDRRLGRLCSPDSGQDHVRIRHGKGLAGIIGRSAIGPADEHLSRRSGQGDAVHAGQIIDHYLGVRGIVGGVRIDGGAAVLVCHREAAGLDPVSRQGDCLRNGRAEVERRAVQSPSGESIAVPGRNRGLGRRAAGSDGLRAVSVLLGSAVQIKADLIAGGRPLGVKHQVARGHGLAGEVVGAALAELVCVPAGEVVDAAQAGRTPRRVSGAADIRLIFKRTRAVDGSIVVKLNIVGVAIVIEVPLIDILVGIRLGGFAADFVAYARVAGKAFDRVVVLFCRSPSHIVGMERINVIHRVAARGQGFQPVIRIQRIRSAGLIQIKACAVQRHGADAGLIHIAVAVRAHFPVAGIGSGKSRPAAGPLGADILSVLGGDRQFGDLLKTALFVIDIVALTVFHLGIGIGLVDSFPIIGTKMLRPAKPVIPIGLVPLGRMVCPVGIIVALAFADILVGIDRVFVIHIVAIAVTNILIFP